MEGKSKEGSKEKTVWSLTKVALTVALTVSFMFVPTVGYYPVGGTAGHSVGAEVWRHVAYMWCHGNVWHLAGNVFVLWLMREPLGVTAGLAIAFVASWLPVLPGVWDWGSTTTAAMTVGFSGVVLAIVGMKWGRYCRSRAGSYRVMMAKMVPALALGALVPHVNWCLHVYCFAAGIGVAVLQRRKERRGKEGVDV